MFAESGGREWAASAACRDEDPELFFAVSNVGPGAAQTAEAKSICQRCFVRSECLEWALSTGQAEGVAGGMTADERRNLRNTGARKSVRV